MAIFKCLEDVDAGPRLTSLEITDGKLVKYIVSIAHGMAKEDALRALTGKNASAADSDFVRSIVEQFPV
jgi:hypothetical protein